jgi:hypothetical protein
MKHSDYNSRACLDSNQTDSNADPGQRKSTAWACCQVQAAAITGHAQAAIVSLRNQQQCTSVGAMKMATITCRHTETNFQNELGGRRRTETNCQSEINQITQGENKLVQFIHHRRHSSTASDYQSIRCNL